MHSDDGYSDSSVSNEGGEYRDDSVDIKTIADGYAIGWMTGGEWLEYTLYVETEGNYDVTVRVGSISTGRTLSISQCGATLLEQFGFIYYAPVP